MPLFRPNPLLPRVRTDTLEGPLRQLRKALTPPRNKEALRAIAQAFAASLPPHERSSGEEWYFNTLATWLDGKSPHTVKSWVGTVVRVFDRMSRARARETGRPPTLIAPHEVTVLEVDALVDDLTHASASSLQTWATIEVASGGLERTVAAWVLDAAERDPRRANEGWTRAQLEDAIKLEVPTWDQLVLNYAPAPGFSKEGADLVNTALASLTRKGLLRRTPSVRLWAQGFKETRARGEGVAEDEKEYPYDTCVYQPKGLKKPGSRAPNSTVVQRLTALSSLWKWLTAPSRQGLGTKPAALTGDIWAWKREQHQDTGPSDTAGRERQTTESDLLDAIRVLRNKQRRGGKMTLSKVLAYRDEVALIALVTTGTRIHELLGARKSDRYRDEGRTDWELVKIRRKGQGLNEENTDLVPWGPMAKEAHEAMEKAMDAFVIQTKRLTDGIRGEANDEGLPMPPELAALADKRKRIQAFLEDPHAPLIPALGRYGTAIRMVRAYGVPKLPRDYQNANDEGMSRVPLDEDSFRQRLVLLGEKIGRMAKRVSPDKDREKRMHPHGFRHLAVAMAETGAPDFGLGQAIAGHRDERTTRRYRDIVAVKIRATEAVEFRLQTLLNTGGYGDEATEAAAEAGVSQGQEAAAATLFAGMQGNVVAADRNTTLSTFKQLVQFGIVKPSFKDDTADLEAEGSNEAPQTEVEASIRFGKLTTKLVGPLVEGIAEDIEADPPAEVVAWMAEVVQAAAQLRARSELNMAAPPSAFQPPTPAAPRPVPGHGQASGFQAPPMVVPQPTVAGVGARPTPVASAPRKSREEAAADKKVRAAMAKAAVAGAIQLPPDKVGAYPADLSKLPSAADIEAPALRQSTGLTAIASGPMGRGKAEAPRHRSTFELFREDAVDEPLFPVYHEPPGRPWIGLKEPPSHPFLRAEQLDDLFAAGLLPEDNVVTSADLPQAWKGASLVSGVRSLFPYRMVLQPGEDEPEADPVKVSRAPRMRPNAKSKRTTRVVLPILDVDYGPTIEALALEAKEAFGDLARRGDARARAFPLWLNAILAHSSYVQRTIGQVQWLTAGQRPEVSGADVEAGYRSVRGSRLRRPLAADILTFLSTQDQWGGRVDFDASSSTQAKRAKQLATAERSIEDQIEELMSDSAENVSLRLAQLPAWVTHTDDPIGSKQHGVGVDMEALKAWCRKLGGAADHLMDPSEARKGAPSFMTFWGMIKPFCNGPGGTLVAPPNSDMAMDRWRERWGVDPVVAARRCLRALWETRKAKVAPEDWLSDKDIKVKAADNLWLMVWSWVLPSTEETNERVARALGQGSGDFISATYVARAIRYMQQMIKLEVENPEITTTVDRSISIKGTPDERLDNAKTALKRAARGNTSLTKKQLAILAGLPKRLEAMGRSAADVKEAVTAGEEDTFLASFEPMTTWGQMAPAGRTRWLDDQGFDRDMAQWDADKLNEWLAQQRNDIALFIATIERVALGDGGAIASEFAVVASRGDDGGRLDADFGKGENRSGLSEHGAGQKVAPGQETVDDLLDLFQEKASEAIVRAQESGNKTAENDVRAMAEELGREVMTIRDDDKKKTTIRKALGYFTKVSVTRRKAGAAGSGTETNLQRLQKRFSELQAQASRLIVDKDNGMEKAERAQLKRAASDGTQAVNLAGKNEKEAVLDQQIKLLEIMLPLPDMTPNFRDARQEAAYEQLWQRQEVAQGGSVFRLPQVDLVRHVRFDRILLLVCISV